MTSATFTALTWKRFTATAIASTTKSSSTSQLFIPKSLSQRRTIASSSFFHQRQQAHSSSTITKTSPVSAPTPVPTSTPSSASPLADLTAEPTETQLPILPRPLGQKEPPTTAQKTWQEKKEEMLDRGKRLEKRKALVKEATQGYFHDFHETRRAGGHGGKTWIGPPVLIREDKSLYFPEISGTNLFRSKTHTTTLLKDKISILVVLGARISEEHAASFVQDVLDDWEGDDGFQYVQINHQPNPLKSLLLTLFISSLKRTMKEERWNSYMIAGGEWGGLKEPLAITNKHVGYVYLVDGNGKIRWAGCGYATPEEKEALRRGVAVLLGRVKEGRTTG